MCNFSDNIERRSVAKSITNLMQNAKVSFEEAAKLIGISTEDFEPYRALVEKKLAESKHENA